MSGVSAAILGCGKRGTGKEGWAIGYAHARGYREARPDVTLYAVDPNDENRAAFAAELQLPADRCFASAAELYAAHVPTVVSVCTWPALHRPLVLEAAAAGVRGIACEKPMALDGAEITEMLDACARRNVKLAIAHQRVHEPIFTQLKQVIQRGVLGDDLCLEFRVGDGWDVLSWTVHWFALASWLFDGEPTTILAGVDHRGARRYQHAVEDASVVFAEYPAAAGHRQAVFITGPHEATGTMVTLRGAAGMAAVRKEGLCLWTRQGFEATAPTPAPRSAFGMMCHELFEAVEHDAPMACDARQLAAATRMAFAAHESARTRRALTPRATPDYAPLEVLQHPPRPALRVGRVVLLADAHHLDAATGLSGRDGVAEALRGLDPQSLTVIAAEDRELVAADLADADLLVLYHTQRRSTAATRAALSAWVEAGRPLLVLHCGIGAYSDWPQFRAWIGRYWVWGGEPLPPSGHPHEPCELQVRDAARFDCPWSAAWLPRDEVYVALADAAPVHELLTARIGEQSHPAAWQCVATPHVAVFAPGHRWDVWNLPTLRTGLAATIALVQAASATAAR